ncbi:MAG: VPGUxxT family thioredoxin-like (seleno)protein, type 2 [Verrucomicrobia bacterium]|nr:VPGUxxT family thioredoxin-like (seleno)protein, type 2 [Verrucomicrobiota bacterium]MDA1088560.1 VPGUxxT family thioredoxin-like (seleno)protein, type 2 [Verrucomicrobiota bacterium]
MSPAPIHARMMLPIVGFAFILAAPVPGDDATLLQRIEVGDVQWGRNLDAGLKASRESGKPVLLLFQEVPGCAGCQKFGRDVLKNPLIVEAAEDEFIPVVIFNNKGGYDAKVLKQHREPAWNYQVVRFLDGEGKELIPRKDRIWTLGGIAARMRDALAAGGRTVPRYLETVIEEEPSGRHGEVALAMHCFWTGEQRLGGIDGVVSTEAGWLEGREVTRIIYRSDQLALKALIERAQEMKCALGAYVDGKALQEVARNAGIDRVGGLEHGYRKAPSSDQKRQISNWPLEQIPGLTAMQQTKLNALGRIDRDRAIAWLSPRQRTALAAGTQR